MIVLTALLVLAISIDDTEGYTFPPVQRGACVATLQVEVVPLGDTTEEPKLPLVHYRITVEGDKGLEVEPVRLGETDGAWIAQRQTRREARDGGTRHIEQIDLQQAQPGLKPLPDVKIRFRECDKAEWQIVEWIDILKDVQELPLPTIQVEPSRSWMWWSAIAATFVVVGAIWLRRRPRPTALTADAEALLALEQLTPELSDREFFTAIADTLRKFLIESLDLPVWHETTDALLFTIANANALDGPTLAALRAALEACDHVRFSGKPSEGEQRRVTLEAARSFIRQTILSVPQQIATRR